jgi:hypothetical protein
MALAIEELGPKGKRPHLQSSPLLGVVRPLLGVLNLAVKGARELTMTVRDVCKLSTRAENDDDDDDDDGDDDDDDDGDDSSQHRGRTCRFPSVFR